MAPIGAVVAWFTATPPTDWLACEGGTALIADYPDLAALWGTTFGGNGTTTFGLPDLRDKPIIGRAASGARATIGAAGGSIPHTHTVDEGSHNHTVDPPSHTHTFTGTAHDHDVNLPADNTGASVGTTNTLTGGQAVASSNHVHSYNPPNTTSESVTATGSVGSTDQGAITSSSFDPAPFASGSTDGAYFAGLWIVRAR